VKESDRQNGQTGVSAADDGDEEWKGSAIYRTVLFEDHNHESSMQRLRDPWSEPEASRSAGGLYNVWGVDRITPILSVCNARHPGCGRFVPDGFANAFPRAPAFATAIGMDFAELLVTAKEIVDASELETRDAGPER
jgi:hypothetical protein